MAPRPDPSQQWSKLAPKMGAAAHEVLNEMREALMASPLALPLVWAKVAREALLKPELRTVLSDPSLGPDKTIGLLILMAGKMAEEIAKQAANVKQGPANAAEMQQLQQKLKQEAQLFEMLNSTINQQMKSIGDSLQNSARM
jgi:hypothetical protein